MARLLPALLPLVFVAGCGGSAASVPSPATNEPEPARGEFALGSLDESCDGIANLTGRAIVAFLAPRYRPTLRWKNEPPTVASLEPTYRSRGPIVCTPRPPLPRDIPPSGTIPTPQPASIRIEFSLHFTTEDGLFDVVLPAVVTARSYGERLTEVSFEGLFATPEQLDPVVLPGRASLSGSFTAIGTTSGQLGQSTGSSEYFVGWWSGR